MFNVLVSTPAHRPLAALVQRLVQSRARTARRPLAGFTGQVGGDRVAVFAHLEGQRIRCVAGALWVTVENDREDHVLAPGQWLRIAGPGKVIVGGRGRFLL